MSSAAYDPARPVSPWSDPLGPVEGGADVRAVVLAGYGLNCEAETKAGFEMAGARADIVHVADLIEGQGEHLDTASIAVFIGGFSFGDHIASGRVFANRLRGRLGDRLARFVDDGGLVLGICNGFQSIVKLGLLPAVGRRPGEGLAVQQASLASNDRLGYRDEWVKLAVDPQSPCVFTRGSSGAILEVPSRHGEGKLLIDESLRAEVERSHLVPVRYVDAAGQPTTAWPDNPNGSMGGAAGLCDVTGRVFGLMPHPEAYLYAENHPDWLEQRRLGALPRFGFGLGLLANGVRAALAST